MPMALSLGYDTEIVCLSEAGFSGQVDYGSLHSQAFTLWTM